MNRQFTISSIILGTVLLALPPAAGAEVYMPEAAKVSGTGATRIAYSMWYSGACAPRVAVSVGYLGRRTMADGLPDLLQYSRDSVRHVLARCPQAEYIEASASDPSAQVYRFVMREADDWAPTELASYPELVDALIGAGYLPVRGPKPVLNAAFVRFANNRLDIVYGKNLDGRMTATHVERNFADNANPIQVSHYVIRGHWFALQSTQPAQAQCPETREGYPLWGSFHMTIYPTGRNLTTTRTHCTDTGEQGRAEAASFNELSSRQFAEYGIAPVSITRVLGERLATAETAAPFFDAEAFSRSRAPLYASDMLRVYARRPDVCTHMEFDAVYRVNSESRDRLFGGSYPSTIGRILKNIATTRCNNARGALVDSYRQGDTERWDRMGFRFQPDQPSAWGNDADYLRRHRHEKSQAAQAHDQWQTANLLGPQCESGPFCDIVGGRYLNAIYRGDLAAIRQMDHLYRESAEAFVDGRLSAMAADASIAALFRTTLNIEELQMLRDTANKYLYSYPAWGESCFDPGAVARTFQYTTPVVIETDDLGITTTSGGIKYEATYTLNPEFFTLRDRIGDAYGAKNSDDPSNLPPKAAVFTGIVEMKHSYDCRSPEVKQFERQLRALTDQVLAEPGTVPPTPANRPPDVKQVLSAPFPAVPEAVATSEPRRIIPNTPAPLPPVATPTMIETQRSDMPTTGTQQAPVAATTPPSDPRVRQQQMMAEMQTFQTRVNEETARLSQSVEQDMRKATTAEERTRILTDYQAKITALQARSQSEIQRIQEKYR